ncbi:MAG TPA: S8 family peptidase [Armatimonadota bacterium]|nr:S8 family peptidase [Armatimonadota bacterium]
MKTRSWNRGVRVAMGAALVVTGWPLLAPWLPEHVPQPPALAGAPAAVPGQVVVDARDTLTPADLQALNSRYGLNLRYNSVHSTEEKLLISDVPVGQEAALLARLRQDPLVEAAEPMLQYSAPPMERTPPPPPTPDTAKKPPRGWTPNDPRFAEQWNMSLIGAEEAWAQGATGSGITVAVIDTGVAFEDDDKCYWATDFKGTRFVAGYDFVNDDAHPNDDNGHGTHVAGTIAETTDNGEGVAGLAYGARIMPLKVLSAWGSGTCADIADAIRFAADNGAKVINLSLGGSQPDAVMHLACKYAAGKGVLIVCAAGNSGGGPVGYPAAFKECLAVSSVGPKGELAPYSSVGPQVAIAAPGGDKSLGEQFGVLQNTVLYDSGVREDGYFAFQGTSMASPHVAATAALAMSRGMTDTAEVRQLLQRGATSKKPTKKYGAGILSASKTVELADTARRDSLLLLLFSVVAGFTGVGVGAIRRNVRGLARFPFMPLGFVMGVLGPDLMLLWLGYGSPFNIVLHSALVPLYLLWEAESPAVRRFVAALAVGVALNLAWDAWRGVAPFAGVIASHAVPWLWVNAVVGVGVALTAWRRSFAG